MSQLWLQLRRSVLESKVASAAQAAPLAPGQHSAVDGMQGIIINGCIRDSGDIEKMPLGVKALNTYPLKSSKRDLGLRDVPVTFASVVVKPDSWIYADKDGVLVAEQELKV